MRRTGHLMRPSLLRRPGLPFLVLLLTAAFLLQQSLAPAWKPDTIPPGALGFGPLAAGQWWSALTWIFTHRDWIHLSGNLLLIIIAGRPVERHFGTGRFLAIFFLGSWLGAAFHLALRPSSVLIGSSGSALALLGACTTLDPHHQLFGSHSRIRLSARSLFFGVLLANAALEITSRLLAGHNSPLLHGQAHLVHLGGLIAGWACASLFLRRTPTITAASLSRPSFPSRPGRRTPSSSAPVPTSAEIDPLLEKLHSRGPGSLSPEEYALLQAASRHFRQSPPD
jgi:membrane associated rhomboid family serine protease